MENIKIYIFKLYEGNEKEYLLKKDVLGLIDEELKHHSLTETERVLEELKARIEGK